MNIVALQDREKHLTLCSVATRLAHYLSGPSQTRNGHWTLE